MTMNATERGRSSEGESYLRTVTRWPFRTFKRKVWGVAPRSANPYATHVPVLVACALMFRPKRILELGSGHISTPLFLNRTIFPDAVYVRSLENDPAWFQQLNSLADPRLERVLVNGSIRNAVAQTDCSEFDLIFVDDSPSAGERRQTLDSLREKIGGDQIVVAHDFDLWPIRLGVSAYPRHYGMKGLTPQCGIAWNRNAVSPDALRAVDDVIQRFRTVTVEGDAAEWQIRFNESLSR